MLQGRRTVGLVEVKICGITNLADALEAISCGAQALGFNLYPESRRFIELESAISWISQLPSDIRKVAVLVNPTRDQALRIARFGLFHSLQLHGNESPEFCQELAAENITFAKALPVLGERSLEQARMFSTDRILLDSATRNGFGGTGRTFPWSLARDFVINHPELRVTLAGGLTPENVSEAITLVRPAGVDVTSGVEASFGRKDPARLRAFITAADNA